MYRVQTNYDEAEILSYIINVLVPPFSLTCISRNLGIPRIRVSRILRRIQKKWWIMATLNIHRICLRKIIILLKKQPSEDISRKALFIGKTIGDKFVLVYFIPYIIDPYEFVDNIENVVSFYVFDKIFYNKPIFKKYFIDGYIRVDLKKIIHNTIIEASLGSTKYSETQYNVLDLEPTNCMTINIIDKMIIEKLVDNGLLSTRMLSGILNIPLNKVNKRIRSLVRNNVLHGFTVGYNKIPDMGEQLFWIVFIIKFNDPKEALYFINKLVLVPFIGHIDYDGNSNLVKLTLRVYRENIGYVYDIAKTIGEKLNVIDTMIVSTKTARFNLGNILNNAYNVRIN